MKCEFILEPKYRHVDGRPVSRCKRLGCNQYAFALPPVNAECRAPHFAAGTAFANVVKKVSRGRLSSEKCEGCGRRRKKWDRRISFAFPFFVYLFLVWLGTGPLKRLKMGIREPLPDRLKECLRIGLIRKV